MSAFPVNFLNRYVAARMRRESRSSNARRERSATPAQSSAHLQPSPRFTTQEPHVCAKCREDVQLRPAERRWLSVANVLRPDQQIYSSWWSQFQVSGRGPVQADDSKQVCLRSTGANPMLWPRTRLARAATRVSLHSGHPQFAPGTRKQVCRQRWPRPSAVRGLRSQAPAASGAARRRRHRIRRMCHLLAGRWCACVGTHPNGTSTRRLHHRSHTVTVDCTLRLPCADQGVRGARACFCARTPNNVPRTTLPFCECRPDQSDLSNMTSRKRKHIQPTSTAGPADPANSSSQQGLSGRAGVAQPEQWHVLRPGC